MVLWRDIWRYAFVTYQNPRSADEFTYHGKNILENAVDFTSMKNAIDYCAIVEEKDRVIVVFRGTPMTNLGTWRSNFDAFPYEHEYFGKVLNGFHDAILCTGFYAAIRNFKIFLDQTNNQKKWIIAGHSRGAGLALMCSWHLWKDEGLVHTNINFAAPAIGDKAFAYEYNAALHDTTNVYMEHDPLYTNKIMAAAGLVHPGHTVICLDTPWYRGLPLMRMRDHQADWFDKRVMQ